MLLFFLIAFAWPWFFWLLQMWGLNLYVAPFGPFIAAFLLTSRNEGKVGVKELFKKGFDPRVGGLWYVPVFLFMPAIAGFSLFLGSIITMTSLSILFTWIYNNTGNSVFATLLFHTMMNLSTYVVFPVFETQTGSFYYLVSILVATIIILAIFGPKRLVREKKQFFLKLS